MFKCLKKKSVISSCVFYLKAKKGWGIGCQRATRDSCCLKEVSKRGLGRELGSTRSPDHQEGSWWCRRSKLKLGSQSTDHVQCSPGLPTATRQIPPSWGQVHMDRALTRMGAQSWAWKELLYHIWDQSWSMRLMGHTGTQLQELVSLKEPRGVSLRVNQDRKSQINRW